MPPRKKAKKAAAYEKRTQRRAKSQGADHSTGKGKDGSCPIVGIGGSAGGFEAAMELLHHLPSRTGMAFVIVQHLDPHHGSRLPNLLGKATSMPVSELAGTTTPKPNEVYVQPPDKCVIAKNGKLTLVGRTERLNLAIDHFFESLAEECGSRAIGIVLSGTGSDGTAGLRAIKAAGGLTFAQAEASAKFDAMPRAQFAPVSSTLFCRPTQSRAKSTALPTIRTSGVPWLTQSKPRKRLITRRTTWGGFFFR